MDFILVFSLGFGIEYDLKWSAYGLHWTNAFAMAGVSAGMRICDNGNTIFHY